MNYPWVGVAVLVATSVALAVVGLKLVKEFKKWYDDK